MGQQQQTNLSGKTMPSSVYDGFDYCGFGVIVASDAIWSTSPAGKPGKALKHLIPGSRMRALEIRPR